MRRTCPLTRAARTRATAPGPRNSDPERKQAGCINQCAGRRGRWGRMEAFTDGGTHIVLRHRSEQLLVRLQHRVIPPHAVVDALRCRAGRIVRRRGACSRGSSHRDAAHVVHLSQQDPALRLLGVPARGQGGVGSGQREECVASHLLALYVRAICVADAPCTRSTANRLRASSAHAPQAAQVAPRTAYSKWTRISPPCASIYTAPMSAASPWRAWRLLV